MQSIDNFNFAGKKAFVRVDFNVPLDENFNIMWEDAGKPMPESEILYPDVGQEEQDMDLQHAARWAMEHDLMPDLNDQDTELPPEQVKFYPDNMVTKISVLRAWKKAQDLKQNAQ